MTEMAHGTIVVQSGDAVLPRWWRTVDRVTIGCVLALFAIGILLGFAASPPLAARNGHEPFYYVIRQFAFGGLALGVMVFVSMMSPVTVRRLAVLGFFAAVAALMLLPIFGTDYGQGAVRWYSLGFASVQPSEFLKPVYVVFTAWMMAASTEINGPPGKAVTLAVTMAIVGFLALQPDFGQAALIVFAWSVIYFVAGAPMTILMAVIGVVGMAGVFAYENSEHFARRIDGFLSAEVDPNTQLGYATNAIREGGLFGAGRRRVGQMDPAGRAYRLHHRGRGRGIRADPGLMIIALYCTIVMRSFYRLMRERDPFIRLAGTGLVSLIALQALINHGRCGAAVAGQGNDAAFCQLWRVVADRHGHCGGHGVVFHPNPAPGRYRRYPFGPASVRRRAA
jgi:cell division protein FtsW